MQVIQWWETQKLFYLLQIIQITFNDFEGIQEGYDSTKLKKNLYWLLRLGLCLSKGRKIKVTLGKMVL